MTMDWMRMAAAANADNTPSTPSAESISTTSESVQVVEATKMKVGYFGNEFPRDDLKDVFRRLFQHSKDRKHPTMARFLEEATLAIKDEVRQLPGPLRMLVPPFETVFNLVDHAELRRGPLGGSVDGMLLCALQIASFIGHHEDNPSETYNYQNAETCLAGLGTGLLSTVAVSLAPTLADLPLTGAEVVRIAFRLGVVVDEVSRNLQPVSADGGHSDSWAYVVPEVSVEEVQAELDAIHKTEKTPAASKVFISALSRTSVTVSGPPARLKHIFLISDFFRDRKSIALPVYSGLCHAKHIYDNKHFDTVVQPTSSVNSLFTPRVPVMSTNHGKPFTAKTAAGLFRDIVEEILTQPIQWDKVVDGIVHRTKRVAASECAVLTFRTNLPARDLVDSLSSQIPQIQTVTRDALQWVFDTHQTLGGPRTHHQAKLAIVGMACRMPGGATDTEKFWDILDQGLDVHRKVPADRFDVDSHTDPTGKRMNTSLTPYGCFIDEPGLFDAPFFNMSPREALQTDPMQRLALVTAYEALERAGYVAGRTASSNLHRIGTFYGQASDDYREVNTSQEIGTYFITGGCRAFGPGRVNYFFKFSGPSYSIDTACSSGLATIHMACNSLWNGDTDMAVAGGMNVLTNSDAFAGLSKGHFLSKTPNACKTWDCEADGYCRADGVASVIIKRLEDAEADNDNILGVILAAGTNHSAEAVSITHPHAGHQADLTRQLLDQAAVDPLDVSFVEMHGTGTQAGDAQEIQSVTEVFAPNKGSARRRSANQPLHIGAVKSNLGHGEAVAGTTALLKVLMMLQKEAIPPHVGIKNSINPGFPQDLDRRQLHIPFQKVPWPRIPGGRKRIAVINNFSAAGGNTSVVIEEAPLRQPLVSEPAEDPRPTHVVAISAKGKASLKGNLTRLLAHLDAHAEEISLPSLSYTTTARRYHHNHRIALAVSDLPSLRRQLSSHIASTDPPKPIPSTGEPSIVFSFTGQGASQRSMSLSLYHHSPTFREQIHRLDALCVSQGFSSIIPVIDGSFPSDYKGHSPTVTQLALVAVEIALAGYWASLGIRPDVVVGHSLGEYAALHVAGVLSAADALYLVGTRAKLLEEKCQVGSHKMLAVRASEADISEAVTTANTNSNGNRNGGLSYEIACRNSPRDTVLSGPSSEITALSELLSSKFKCVLLDVAFAFHSAQTDPILQDFETAASRGVLFQPPNLPVISPLLGKVVFGEGVINAGYIRRATRESVNFTEAIQTAKDIDTVGEDSVWIEIGPHPVGVGFVKAILPAVNVAVPSLRRGEDDWGTLARSLAAVHVAGVNVGWNEFHRPFEQRLKLLDLPTYAWNDKTLWLQYNGDWALTKGNTFYDEEKKQKREGILIEAPVSSLHTSLVHRVVEETFSGAAGRVVVQSDMMQADFLAAAWGHQMNGAGVVTSSIHADIAFTLGKYLAEKLLPQNSPLITDMDISSLNVREGLVAQKNKSIPQLIRIAISTPDITSNLAHLAWHNVAADGTSLIEEEPIVTATLRFGSSTSCLAEWSPLSHLVQSRVSDLARLADEGIANRLSRNMAYRLFGANLVNYADKYRGMHTVVLHGLEGYADVVLSSTTGGSWTVPPFFIDSVCHLAGFIMNVSDAIDTANNFCVTPGWESLRLAKPLVPGGKYRSYVKMIPTPEDGAIYFGDVYIMDNEEEGQGEIVGVMRAIKFRRYPRVLLNRFFSAVDVKNVGKGVPAPVQVLPKAAPVPVAVPVSTPVSAPASIPITAPPPVAKPTPPAAAAPTATTPAPTKTAPEPAASDSVAAKAMLLVAAEAGIDVTELHDDASFANIGVDSLMSLVIAEKLREQLGVSVSGSLFLEYPNVGDLRAWLVEYYS